MRAGLVGALGVTVFVLLAAQGGGAARTHVRPCPTSAGMKDASKPNKPSSFAPRPRPRNNAYGAPIGDKILTKRVKKKASPGATTPPAAS
jgi:hypothetical protein